MWAPGCIRGGECVETRGPSRTFRLRGPGERGTPDGGQARGVQRHGGRNAGGILPVVHGDGADARHAVLRGLDDAEPRAAPSGGAGRAERALPWRGLRDRGGDPGAVASAEAAGARGRGAAEGSDRGDPGVRGRGGGRAVEGVGVAERAARAHGDGAGGGVAAADRGGGGACRVPRAPPDRAAVPDDPAPAVVVAGAGGAGAGGGDRGAGADRRPVLAGGQRGRRAAGVQAVRRVLFAARRADRGRGAAAHGPDEGGRAGVAADMGRAGPPGARDDRAGADEGGDRGRSRADRRWSRCASTWG